MDKDWITRAQQYFEDHSLNMSYSLFSDEDKQRIARVKNWIYLELIVRLQFKYCDFLVVGSSIPHILQLKKYDELPSPTSPKADIDIVVDFNDMNKLLNDIHLIHLRRCNAKIFSEGWTVMNEVCYPVNIHCFSERLSGGKKEQILNLIPYVHLQPYLVYDKSSDKLNFHISKYQLDAIDARKLIPTKKNTTHLQEKWKMRGYTKDEEDEIASLLSAPRSLKELVTS